ncbi:hypothetical protein FHQ18_07770 [Deferribacter autotrophicus]|uniref:Uncharacterized protein n=1 Tax=Deferribacter autotrophicus TaxID=500465 RepID=A0A5A8F2E2_9BACT|nr:hypothetical protein [Deferribacter autotrophicus]KAA0257634.1 hypothetical protein FHQ18_07770 [Deferribacter autotrophicus]
MIPFLFYIDLLFYLFRLKELFLVISLLIIFLDLLKNKINKLQFIIILFFILSFVPFYNYVIISSGNMILEFVKRYTTSFIIAFLSATISKYKLNIF